MPCYGSMNRSLALAVVGFTFTGSAVAQAQETLLGAGATFPAPLYNQMFEQYRSLTGIEVIYDAVGSGGGQTALRRQEVQFGASDAPLSDVQARTFPGEVLHIPMALGAVVPIYNLPGFNQTLNFSGEVLADFFLGKITNWNDPRIAQLNPGIELPNLPVTIVHRIDGSGTTFVFVDYLSKVSQEWKIRAGVGSSVAWRQMVAVDWPVGLGGDGNGGVAELVQAHPGALGYVEVAYAEQNHLPYGAVQNRAGKFVKADVESIGAAADFRSLPEDPRALFTDTDNPEGYPIASLTWILVYTQQELTAKSREQAQQVVDLLWWMTHEGQELNEPLSYGRLPAIVVERNEKLLHTLRYQGRDLSPTVSRSTDPHQVAR